MAVLNEISKDIGFMCLVLAGLLAIAKIVLVVSRKRKIKGIWSGK